MKDQYEPYYSRHFPDIFPTFCRETDLPFTLSFLIKFSFKEIIAYEYQTIPIIQINEVDVTRQRLVKFRNQLSNESKNALRNFETSKTHINSSVDTYTFDEDLILNFGNENREILGGESVNVIDSSTVRFDLHSLDIISDDENQS